MEHGRRQQPALHPPCVRLLDGHHCHILHLFVVHQAVVYFALLSDIELDHAECSIHAEVGRASDSFC